MSATLGRALLPALVALALCGCSARAPRGGGAFFYGEEHAFLLATPPGWALDEEAGRKQGLLAVLYPRDSTWADAGEVMYVNTAEKESDTTLEDLMLTDLVRQREDSPGVQMKPAPPLPIADGTLVPVNEFSGDTWGNSESVAYLDGGKVWVMIVLTARTAEGHTRARAPFAELVHSYHLMATDLQAAR